MNRFCKAFFSVFFSFVFALMLLLSYGLSEQLRGMARGSGENLIQMAHISAESVCQLEEDLLYWS